MKKFLTVLLALSVVFTYTVGSAFAATGVEGDTTTTHAEAMQQAEKAVVDEFNEKIAAAKAALADEYTETKIHNNCVIDGDVYAATLDQIAAQFTNIVKVAAQEVDASNQGVTDADTLATEIKAVTDIKTGLAYGSTTEIKVDVADLANLTVEGLRNYVTADADANASELQAYYMVYTWSNALSSMKAYLNGELAKIDMSLYTNDVADEDDPYQKTWAQKAQEAKDELSKAVSDTTVTVGMGQTPAKNALKAMYDTVFAGITAYDTVKDTSGQTIVVSYQLSDPSIKTKDDLAEEDADNAATKAELKAMVQSDAATAQRDALDTYNESNKDSAAKEALEEAQANIDAYVEVNTVLIDEGKITTPGQIKQNRTPNRPDCLKRVNLYQDAADLSAVLKVQVEKDGTLKYIASKVDENLAKVKVDIYNTGEPSTETAMTAALIDGAANESDNLAWKKEVALANVDKALAAALDAKEYYEPEKAQVEAKYQEWKDKINAAATVTQLNTVENAEPSITDIGTKTEVNDKVESYVNTKNFLDSVKSYIYYLNIGINSYEDGYRKDPSPEDVAKYLAENGARSNADVAGLYGQAEAYARSLPTNGETKAEKAAVDALVAAIPSVVTLADKPTIKAAYEAAEKAGYTPLPTKLQNAIALVKDAEDKAIDNMLAALPKTLTAADKAAVDAILDAIDTYESEDMYGKTPYDKANDAQKAFEAVRQATLTDVQNAIAALPTDATESQVEAVRAAVDDFVATYTDPAINYQAIAKIENLDKLTFIEAKLKAETIQAVYGTHVKIWSSSGKGYIKIRWDQNDNGVTLDGYEVYRSTKKTTGFSKISTFKVQKQKTYKINMKKGTKYYFKIKGYKMVDGEKVYAHDSITVYRTFR